jgi:hypothetical protein
LFDAIPSTKEATRSFAMRQGEWTEINYVVEEHDTDEHYDDVTKQLRCLYWKRGKKFHRSAKVFSSRLFLLQLII